MQMETKGEAIKAKGEAEAEKYASGRYAESGHKSIAKESYLDGRSKTDEEKEKEISDLKKKLNDLTFDNMTYEYNQAEGNRVWPQIEEQIKKEACEEKDKKIAYLKKLITEDLVLAIKVLNRILSHIGLDLGADAAKKMLHDIDQLTNKEVNSQEKPIM